MKKFLVLFSVFTLTVCLTVPQIFASGGQSGAAAGGSAAGGKVANMNLTGYPIAVQTANLSVAVTKRPQHNRSVADFAYFIALEKQTNVKINWIEWETGDANDKRRLAFATNQLPDVFLPLSAGNDTNYYGSQGQLLPLNDLIKNYAPDMLKVLNQYPDSYGMMANPDNGNWYAMVQIRDPMYIIFSDPDLYINKKWCDNLGLKVPETITDYYNVLKEFKARDANGNGNPNDEIPFSFTYQEGAPQYSYTGLYILFFPFGVAENNNHLMVVNGKLQHTFTMPQFRDGVRMLAQMYKDGLIDPESFTMNRQQLFAACKAKEIGSSIGYAITNNFGPEKTPDYTTLYLKGPDGQNPVAHMNAGAGGPGSGPAISSACKIPEIAIRWINEFYKPQLAAEQMYGNLGMYLIPSKNPPLLYDFAPVPAGMNLDEYRFSTCDALGAEFYKGLNMFPLTDNDALKKQSDDAKAAYFTKEPLPNFVYNQSELDEIQAMQTELNTFCMNTLAQWIVKGTVDQEWDQVQQQLVRMKLPRYMEINQKVYERMIAAK
ncbi:MAG: extracellular solute-binding protein [Treponema sp.]|nr:extracellular solute-binding protein [Treponema sp.]